MEENVRNDIDTGIVRILLIPNVLHDLSILHCSSTPIQEV